MWYSWWPVFWTLHEGGSPMAWIGSHSHFPALCFLVHCKDQKSLNQLIQKWNLCSWGKSGSLVFVRSLVLCPWEGRGTQSLKEGIVMLEMQAFAPQEGEVWACVSTLNSGIAETERYKKYSREQRGKSLISLNFCLFSIISYTVFLCSINKEYACVCPLIQK